MIVWIQSQKSESHIDLSAEITSCSTSAHASMYNYLLRQVSCLYCDNSIIWALAGLLWSVPLINHTEAVLAQQVAIVRFLQVIKNRNKMKIWIFTKVFGYVRNSLLLLMYHLFISDIEFDNANGKFLNRKRSLMLLVREEFSTTFFKKFD